MIPCFLDICMVVRSLRLGINISCCLDERWVGRITINFYDSRASGKKSVKEVDIASQRTHLGRAHSQTEELGGILVTILLDLRKGSSILCFGFVMSWV